MKFRAFLLAVVLLVAFPPLVEGQSVYGSGIEMSIESIYDFSSPSASHVKVIYKFRNPLERAAYLEYSSQFSYSKKVARIVSVTDDPKGSVKYEISPNGKEVVFSFARNFVPGETYSVTINIDSPVTSESSGDRWRFKNIEANFFSWPLKNVKTTMILPGDLFSSYKLTKIDPGATLKYEGFKKVVEWEKEPLESDERFVTSAEYYREPNIHAIATTAFFVLLFGILAYMHFVKRRGFVIPRGFTKTLPGKNYKGETNTSPTIEDILQKANKEVLITSPWIYYVDWFTSHVKQLTDKGIKVQIVTWPGFERVKIGKRWEIKELRRQAFALERFLDMFPSGTVKLNESLHSKMVVVDSRIVFVSSSNLTQTGLWENFEAGMWIEDIEIAKQAKDYFEKLWNSEKSVTLTRDLIGKK